MHRQSPRPSRRNAALRIGGIILTLIVVFALGQHFSGQATSKSTSAPKAEKVTKSTTNAASSAASSSTTATATSSSHSADPQVTDALKDLTQVAGENTETQTGGRVTYSRFYQAQGTWYWEMTADTQTAPVEVAEVTGATREGETLNLAMTSQVYQPNHPYKLAFHWLDQDAGEYNLHTDFKSINGNYTLGQTGEVAQAQNDTASMAWTLGSGEGVEDDSTLTDHGAVTYSDFTQDSHGDWYWELTSDKRGEVEWGKVTAIRTQDGIPVRLQVRSEMEKSQGQTYTVNVQFNDDLTQYHLTTAQDQINGRYNIDEDD